MNLVPTRPFLKLPAWAWLLLPMALAFVILLVGPPEKLPEPLGSTALEVPVLVTRARNAFRFVPLGSEKDVRPLWVITAQVAEQSAAVDWQFGWVDGQLVLGLYRRESRWRYQLAMFPCDNSFKDGQFAVPELSEPEQKIIRAELAKELNERYPGEHLGNLLQQALTGGIEQVSYVCFQNVLLMMLWISLLLAFVAVWTMTLPGESDDRQL